MRILNRAEARLGRSGEARKAVKKQHAPAVFAGASGSWDGCRLVTLSERSESKGLQILLAEMYCDANVHWTFAHARFGGFRPFGSPLNMTG